MNIQSLTTFPLAAVQALARMFGGTSQVRSGFALTAVGAGSLGVTVAAGTAWVNGVYLDYAGGSLTPGAASATLHRYDLIVVLSGAVVPSIVAGTAAAAPVPPALAAGALFLGYVFIGATATDYTVAAVAFIADYTVPIVNFAGTAAAPVMAPTGDLNTGWVFPGADRVQQVTGGVVRWETTAAGHLVPVSTSITDLGSSTQRWRDLFLVSASIADLTVVSLHGSLAFVGVRVRASTNQAFASASTEASINFTTEDFDTASMWASASGARIVVTQPGIYQVGVNALFEGLSSTAGVVALRLYQNTSVIAVAQMKEMNTRGLGMTAQTVVSAVSTDFFLATFAHYEPFATAASTSVLGLTPAFWAYRVD